MHSTALSSGVSRSTQSPQRTGVNSGVRGISIIPPRVQTSAAHARRYEGAAATVVPESGIVGNHASRAAIADSLDNRNTQVLQSQQCMSVRDRPNAGS